MLYYNDFLVFRNLVVVSCCYINRKEKRFYDRIIR